MISKLSSVLLHCCIELQERTLGQKKVTAEAEIDTHGMAMGRDSTSKEEKSKTKQQEEYLINAASQGKIYELKQALLAGAFVDSRDQNAGNTPLMLAAFNGHIEVIRILLKNHADIESVSSDGNKTPLMMAGRDHS